MPIRRARYWFGTTILGSHFLAMLLFFYFGQYVYTEFSDILQGVLTLTPLTATYSGLFVKYVAGNPELHSSEMGRHIEADAFFTQYGIIAAFCGTLVFGILYLFITSSIRYENIRVFSGLLDTIFGGYLGIIFGRLFPSEIMGERSVSSSSS